MRELYRLVIEELGAPASSIDPKNEAIFPCPNCHHISSRTKTQKSLAINFEHGRYHCWYCGFAGMPKEGESPVFPIARLFKKIGRVEIYKKLIGLKDEYKTVKDIDNLFALEKDEKERVEIPYGFEDLYHKLDDEFYQRPKNYLLNRGVTETDILKYDIKFRFKDQLILIPSYGADLNLNYYVSRSILPEDEAPYRNPYVKKQKIIFNEFLIDWESDLFVVEGIFDAIVSGKNAVPILGSYMSKDSKLFKTIINKNCNVVLALDPDADRKQKKLAQDLFSNGVNVDYIEWTHKTSDIAELGRVEFNKLCNEQRRSYNDVDLLKYTIIDRLEN